MQLLLSTDVHLVHEFVRLLSPCSSTSSCLPAHRFTPRKRLACYWLCCGAIRATFEVYAASLLYRAVLTCIHEVLGIHTYSGTLIVMLKQCPVPLNVASNRKRGAEVEAGKQGV